MKNSITCGQNPVLLTSKVILITSSKLYSPLCGTSNHEDTEMLMQHYTDLFGNMLYLMLIIGTAYWIFAEVTFKMTYYEQKIPPHLKAS